MLADVQSGFGHFREIVLGLIAYVLVTKRGDVPEPSAAEIAVATAHQTVIITYTGLEWTDVRTGETLTFDCADGRCGCTGTR